MNCLFRHTVITIVIVPVLLFVHGCTSRPISETIPVSESRASRLHWYDETHKAYYDVRGPVKEIRQSPLVREASALGDMHWQYRFDRAGRLMRKSGTSATEVVETRYAYYDDGRRKNIESYLNNEPWRVSQYRYEPGGRDYTELLKDNKSGTALHVKHQRIRHGVNWLHTRMPVETVDALTAHEITQEGELLWSNKGGFNNGMGLRYAIKVTDTVTSSRVRQDADGVVETSGGYRYAHDDSGRLMAVESLSADNGGVYHTTRYLYNASGLLESERKTVTGNSLFNDAVNEHISYEYLDVDRYGNWLRRRFVHSRKGRQVNYEQRREISYY